VRAPFHERSCSPPSHLEGSGRRGRGLLVGRVWHLRMRLVILRVRDGAGVGYWWVECGTCECGWQAAQCAESVGDEAERDALVDGLLVAQ